MNLLIVEDEPILRSKYESYLEDLFEEVYTSSTIEEAKKMFDEYIIDVALLDYNLPDGAGLEIIKSIQKDDAPVYMMLTAYSKENVAIESLNLGVFRYLQKPLDKSALIQTMNECLIEAENRNKSNKLLKKFTILEKTNEYLKTEYMMSSRELEVLEAVLLYGKNKIIAKKLFISPGTVRNHISNIFSKLHMANKDELALFIEKTNQKLSL